MILCIPDPSSRDLPSGPATNSQNAMLRKAVEER